jgi:hypothetical protein
MSAEFEEKHELMLVTFPKHTTSGQAGRVEEIVDSKVKYASSRSNVSIWFLMHMLYSHKCSFELCCCILFNYMFQYFYVELIPRGTGNEY